MLPGDEQPSRLFKLNRFFSVNSIVIIIVWEICQYLPVLTLCGLTDLSELHLIDFIDRFQ